MYWADVELTLDRFTKEHRDKGEALMSQVRFILFIQLFYCHATHPVSLSVHFPEKIMVKVIYNPRSADAAKC